jgi:hypothetical protein
MGFSSFRSVAVIGLDPVLHPALMETQRVPARRQRLPPSTAYPASGRPALDEAA